STGYVTPSVFVFRDSEATEFHALSLHDALPISFQKILRAHLASLPIESGDIREFFEAFFEILRDDRKWRFVKFRLHFIVQLPDEDRKSTRLNSSHVKISYAVFSLQTKNWKKAEM